MDIPIWFSLATAAFIATVAAMLLTRLTRLWRKTREDPGSLDEPWDPFA